MCLTACNVHTCTSPGINAYSSKFIFPISKSVLIDLFSNLSDLYQERVVEDESARTMASKREIVVDKAALIILGHQIIICSRSVSWWDEELRQIVEVV